MERTKKYGHCKSRRYGTNLTEPQVREDVRSQNPRFVKMLGYTALKMNIKRTGELVDVVV
jgi:hypothetical protein